MTQTAHDRVGESQQAQHAEIALDVQPFKTDAPRERG